MLRKLLKHEFKATARVIPYTYLAIVISFVILCTFVLVGVKGVLFKVAVTMLNIITLLAAYFIVFGVGIILTVRYYRSMYGSESYLTHSIPVKGHTLVLSKSLTSFVWLLCTELVSGVSVIAFIWTISNIIEGSNAVSIQEFIEPIGNISEYFIDSDMGSTLVRYIIAFFIGTYQMISAVVFSITLGSCSKFHKLGVGGPILIYFANTVIVSILSTVLSTSLVTSNVIFEAINDASDAQIFNILLDSINALMVVLSVIYTVLSCYIADKHTSLK